MRNCKACGGSIKYVNGHVAKCEYCGKLFQADGDEFSEVNVESLYKEASNLFYRGSEEDLQSAIEIFDALGSYKDSSYKVYEGKNKISKARADEADRKLEEQRQNEMAEIERKKRAYKEKQKRKIITIVSVAVIALITIIVATVSVINSQNNEKYQKAVDYMEQGEYEEAAELFEKLGDYKDSANNLRTAQEVIETQENTYNKGVAYYNEGLYLEAIATLSEIPDYLDSPNYVENSVKALFEEAQSLFDSGDYEKCKTILSEIPADSSYSAKATALLKDADDQMAEIQIIQAYENAVEAYENEDYEKAQKLFMELGDYQEACGYLDQIGEIFFSRAESLYESGEVISCGDTLLLIDESKEWNQYQLAVELFSTIKDPYIAEVSTEAKDICRSQGESEMKDFINGKVCCLLSDDEASELKKECVIKQVSMDNMEPYVEGDYGLGHEFSEEDTLGNTYAFVFHGYMDIEDGGAYEIFNIRSEYKYLNATVAVRKPWSNIGENYIGHIKIYGDDRLIWSDDNIKGTTKPYDIQVNIEGVEDLKIEMYGDGNFGNSGIHVLLCNPTLSE